MILKFNVDYMVFTLSLSFEIIIFCYYYDDEDRKL